MTEFYFGAATSSHQVEGSTTNDWSVWEKANAERLSKASGNKWPAENYISGKACDHYHRFLEDFDTAKSLGHNAHRFSIEWSRIEPEKGKFDEREIAHYREVLKALRDRNIEPFVTVWHWTLPLWLAQEGGLLAKKFPEYFARYAETLASEFKEVNFWITVNEPEVVTWNGYGRGIWPPQYRSKFMVRKAMRALILAHKESYVRIKKIAPHSQVGATMHMDWFESAGGWINNLLAFFADRFVNFYFLHGVLSRIDFIGFNYYFHNRIDYGFNKNRNQEVSDMGWEIYPEGIYRVLQRLKKYDLPIYITENGLADAADSRRASFITRHLEWVEKAITEGVDVRGYFHWSLLDNFEWDKGFWPRFGLIEVDYRTLERKIRPSAFVYKKIIEESDEKLR
jgi:beta-glucosidase